MRAEMAEDSREELQELVEATGTAMRDMIRRGHKFDLEAPSEPPPLASAPTLEEVREELGECTRCPLHAGRNKLVFGVGNPQADLVLVGEAPGRDEDKQGEPFVGRAGKLLDDILAAIGLSRKDVYICNVVKCRPPENRNPEPGEIEICSPFLWNQIRAIEPKLICTLGKFAAQTLLDVETPIGKLRGAFHDCQGTPLLATYHPAYLLRNPSAKVQVWEDMKKLHAELCRLTGKKIPRKGS